VFVMFWGWDLDSVILFSIMFKLRVCICELLHFLFIFLLLCSGSAQEGLRQKTCCQDVSALGPGSLPGKLFMFLLINSLKVHVAAFFFKISCRMFTIELHLNARYPLLRLLLRKCNCSDSEFINNRVMELGTSAVIQNLHRL
jgi:hypothetical protein